MAVSNILITTTAGLMLTTAFLGFRLFNLTIQRQEIAAYIDQAHEQFLKDNISIDTILFNYQQFIGQYRKDELSAFEDLNNMPFPILDTLMQPFIDTQFLGLYIDHTDYYNWLKKNECKSNGQLEEFRNMRLREMYYEVLIDASRRQGCTMHLPYLSFNRSVGEETVYFGNTDIAHDHVKFLVQLNDSLFQNVYSSSRPVPIRDTLSITVYRVSMEWNDTKLDTLQGEVTLAWIDDRWKRINQ